MSKISATGIEQKVYEAVIRVSRKNGRDGDSFLSPDEQRNIIVAWIEASGHKIGQWHDETDSVSGKTTDRKGLKAALKRCKDGKANGIVVAKVDRFSRNLVEGLLAVKALEDNGHDFIAVKDGLTGGRAEAKNPTARLLRGILFLLAEWQLDSLTDGWDIVRHAKVAAGIHLAIPFAYRRSVNTGGKHEGQRKASPLEPVEPMASFVREVFAMRGRGLSWQKIADYMNTKCKTPNGKVWTIARVRDLVHCRAYLGEARSGIDNVKKDAHPAIVTQDAWDRAHARASRRHASPDGGYLLSGLIRCAGCGYVMVHNNNGKGVSSYKCSRKHGAGECAVPATVNGPTMEALVVERFKADYGDRSYTGTKLGTEATDTAAEADAAARRHAMFLDAMPDDMSDRALANWKATEKRKREEMEAADAAHSEARNEALGEELPTDLLAIFDASPIPVQRELMARVFGVIAVRKRIDHTDPLAFRVRIIGKHDLPTDLPGFGVAGIRPIPIGPKGVAGVTLGEQVADEPVKLAAV